MPSRGPKSGRNCYVTPAFSGVPSKEDKIRSGYITLAFSGAQKRAEMRCNPDVPRGPQVGGQNQKWLHHPYLLGGPKTSWKCSMTLSGFITRAFSGAQKRNCYITRAFSKVPSKEDKIRSGCITLAFSGARKRAEKRRNPDALRGPQNKGTKSQVAASALPSRGPKTWWRCCITHVILRGSQEGQNQKWLHHRCLLRGPTGGGVAT